MTTGQNAGQNFLRVAAVTERGIHREIAGLRRPLNFHLIKLLAAAVSAETRAHWEGEATDWLAQIGRLRLKPRAAPAPAAFYYNLLYEAPFGDAAAGAIVAELQLLVRKHPIHQEARVADIIARLSEFHRAFSQLCAAGYDDGRDRDRLRDLVARLGR